ncbi:homoserine kinase [Candidatus Desulfovibrio trichonymphae]|uniref:Shikimate kinase n=1 Tax=Candidatus Desulfovibrio trichonymphae TaxID=1725232 RepID=A0A1J1DRK6_9BACT|nr:homoserine kinase [Candidatus Desulfovibrio trichonymphae]BAV92495.1 shikimate kinase [Candidatus Desulfovibrio trichonymphae]GHU96023.1 shikimate kinase [Deltaproteobacteria bacterium]GHU97467.1 shikimate kinase [Deltaproteobacteria bacterium]
MPIDSLITAPRKLAPCIVLIGMAGAGKSTVGEAIARALDWAFLDSDSIIEAIYGARLQTIADALGKDAFIDAECEIIRSLRINRTVIATGGSVVYRDAAMRHLTALGPLVYLDAPFVVIEKRVAAKPDRGLAIAPGESLADLFYERADLYNAWAPFHCAVHADSPGECARRIIRDLPPEVVRG